MRRTHVSLDDETFQILELYRKNKKYSYSRTIKELVSLAHNYNIITDQLEKILEMINNVYGKEYLIVDLIKQLYSDLEIENHTDPNKNMSLKEFFIKRKVGTDG